MIERVAMVLVNRYCVFDPLGNRAKLLPYEECTDGVREIFIGHAKAVIAAMREPTEEMSRCGANALMHDMTREGIEPRPAAGAIWRVMIDEALK